jgi:predicted glycogen debranching enzyme
MAAIILRPAERAESVDSIRLSADECRDLSISTRREWLETNGRGGFAFGTVAGMRTRRYHGLLMVATRPPGGRMLLLSSLEEAVMIGQNRWDLGCNHYPGVVHPAGHELLAGFELELFPTWTYRLGSARLTRSICTPHGEDAVILTYTATGLPPDGASLELHPLLAYRDYHSLQRQNDAVSGSAVQGDGWIRFCPYDGCPPLYLCAGGFEYQTTGYWYHAFEYDIERERGLDSIEDLYNPGLLRLTLRPGEPLVLVAAAGPMGQARAAKLVEAEVSRRAARRAPVAEYGPVAGRLALAADQFIVGRGEGGETVIAGYPWFEDWGRDTMISLPGLTLTTGRFDTARRILATFAGAVNQGMLPNRFPDWATTPEYNTVDATLWFFTAAWRCLEATSDLTFVRKELLPVFRDIIDWHRKGTRYGIRVEAVGLLHAGEPGTQLTWMDAKVGDWVVTPRTGKPVEIQALWYNALRITEALCQQTRQTARAREYGAWADQAWASFQREFWYEAGGYLCDVVDGEQRDTSLRPNQLFALSLPFPLLESDRAHRVLAAVEAQLLTPMGLRTLAPSDPQYVGRYEGDVWRRDSAYHQGTVWPWLIGPYVDAVLRVRGTTPAVKAAIRAQLAPLVQHLREAGLGSISEIADADPPHRPNGCPAQAWSVAELLRAWIATA